MKIIKPYIKYLILGLIVLSSFLYVNSYNSSYNELESSIEKEDYKSANILLDELDKFPLKIKNINELRSITILSTLDSLPEFKYYLKNIFSGDADSLGVIKNNEILRDLDLIDTNNSSIELEKLTLTANLFLNNIFLTNISSGLIKDIKYVDGFWEKDNLKYSGGGISSIFRNSEYNNFNDFIKEYKNLGADYDYTYESEIDSIGDDVSAWGIYDLSLDSNKEINQIISDYKIIEIKNKNSFRKIQLVNNSLSLIELIDYVILNFDLDDLKLFTSKKIKHEMFSLVNIIAIVYPSIENIKNFTGVDISKENIVCCFNQEQDKMASIIRSLVLQSDLLSGNKQEEYSYNRVYSKEFAGVYPLLFNYLSEPFKEGDASIIRSGDLFNLIANPYFCRFCRFDFFGKYNNLASYIEYSKSHHNTLTSMEKKFAVSLANFVFLSDENYLSLENNSNVRYGIYRWYREYLVDIGNNSKALQVHNKLANLNDDNLNVFKTRILIGSHYWIGAGIRWNREDWKGAILDFNKALEYLELINYKNEANPEIFLEGISKARILRQRGLAQMLYDSFNRKITKYSDSTGCLDLRTASNLDSDYYDIYVKYCLN